MAIAPPHISMAVFLGLSAYGFLLYYEGGADAAKATTLLTTLSYLAVLVICIAGIGFFGVQLDRRKAEERREEDRQAAVEAARKGRRKPLKGA